jgi:cobalt/nickel transport system permease protein
VHHRLLSLYQHRESPIHRLPATVKLIGALVFVFAVVLLPLSAWPVYALGGAALLLIAAFSRLGPLELARKLLWVEPFALGVALLSLLQSHGVSIFTAMLVRSTLCLLCMVLLSSTTRFTDLLQALRRARFPSLLVTTLALMYRYVFLLYDEMGRMRGAPESHLHS